MFQERMPRKHWYLHVSRENAKETLVLACFKRECLGNTGTCMFQERMPRKHWYLYASSRECLGNIGTCMFQERMPMKHWYLHASRENA